MIQELCGHVFAAMFVTLTAHYSLAMASNFFYGYQPYEIRNVSVVPNGEIKLNCVPDNRDYIYRQNINEFTWYTGPKAEGRQGLDKTYRQAIIIVVESDNMGTISTNFARKFPAKKKKYYKVDINNSPSNQGRLIIREANKEVEGLYGCTYGDLNTESPITYYVSVASGAQAAANDKYTDSATTQFQLLTSTNFLLILSCSTLLAFLQTFANQHPFTIA